MTNPLAMLDAISPPYTAEVRRVFRRGLGIAGVPLCALAAGALAVRPYIAALPPAAYAQPLTSAITTLYNGTDFGASFYDHFTTRAALAPAATEETSQSRFWWLYGGGSLLGGRSRGVILAPAPDSQRAMLLTRSRWSNAQTTLYLRITRHAPPLYGGLQSGFFLAAHHTHEGHFYLAGLRADGTALIAKAADGAHQLLASAPAPFPARNAWTGIRLVSRRAANGQRLLALYTDHQRSGSWTLLLEAADSEPDLPSLGRVGIVADMLDAELDDIEVRELP